MWYLVEARRFKRMTLGIWGNSSNLEKGAGRGESQSHPCTILSPPLQSLFSELHALCVVFSVGEVADDSQRAEEDHVLSDVPCHRHHLCDLVLVCAH